MEASPYASDRISSLDILRFFAAIMVVFFHYTFRGNAADNLMDVGFPEISSFSKYLYLGVELFFMISGFVILMSASSGSLRSFVISRIARLYPAFWFCCTLTLVFILLFDDGRLRVSIPQYILNMTMFHEFFGVAAIDGVYWSLTVELKFYLLIGLLLFFKKLDQIRVVLYLWLTLSIINYFLNSWTINFYANASYAPYFCIGSFSYLLYRDGRRLLDILGIVTSWLLSILYSAKSSLEIESHYGVEISQTIIFSWISIFTVLIFLNGMNRMSRISFNWITALGTLTYPLYLLHQNIGYILFNRLINSEYRYIGLFFTIFSMLIISYWVSIRIEKPMSYRIKYLLKN